MSSPRLIPPSSPPFQSAQPRESPQESDDDEASSANNYNSLKQANSEQASDESDIYKPRNPYKPRKRPRKPEVSQSIPSLKPSKPTTSRQSKRYTGPKSTWRSWTAADRAIATSLDQITSQDLSLHLYNAHAFKQRARLARQDPTTGDHNERLWEPPRMWTAWPLRAEDVPRERDGKWEEDCGEGDLGRKRKRDPRKAGEDIQDILVGVVLKTARERLREEYPPRDEAERSPSSSDSDSDSSPSSSSKISTTTSSPSASPSFSSSTPQPPNPTPLLDDALAHSILLPTLRHTLTNLDHLLAGLHSARQASLRIADVSASGTDCETSNCASDDDSAPKSQSKSLRRRGYESRSRSRSKHWPAKPKPNAKGKGKGKATAKTRSSAVTDEEDELDSEAELTSPLPETTRSRFRARSRPSLSPRSRAKALQRRQMRLGLRDWSDVLGIAALQGWNGVVIDAAAKRCAALFGEGMDFRVLGAEAGERVKEVRYRPEGRS